MYNAIIIPVSNWAMVHVPALWVWLCIHVPGVVLMYAIYVTAVLAAMAIVSSVMWLGRAMRVKTINQVEGKR